MVKPLDEPRRCATANCANTARPQRRLCNTCRARVFRARNPESAVLNCMRCHARQRGIVFALTVEDLRAAIAGTDYLTRRGTEPDALQLDRKDHRRGYVPGNLQVLTCAENARKGRFERLDLFAGDADESGLEDLPIEEVWE